MKQMEKMWGGEYISPTLEVLDIAVEQGFAGSVIAEDWEDGNVDWFEQETVL